MEVKTPPSADEGKPQRRYSRWVKCLSVLISIALTLLALEAGARLVLAVRGVDIRSYQPSFIYAQGAGTQSDRSSYTSQIGRAHV